MIELRKPSKSLNLYNGQALKFRKSDGTETALLMCSDNDYAVDPRTEDDGLISRMYCWHRRYHLGDKHTFTDTAEMLCSILRELNINTTDEIEQDAPKMMSLLHDFAVVLPLWLYDHSGITMSCGERNYPYNDRWDSGQVGWIIILKKDMEEAGLTVDDDWRRKALDICRDDVRIYDLWLTGEVYGFQIYEKKDDEWVETDSCWGFYGSNLLDNGMTDCVDDLATAIETGDYEITSPKQIVTVKFSFD